MKKIILCGLVVVVSLGLVGCTKTPPLNQNETGGGNQGETTNYIFRKDSDGYVDVMKESTKIQLNQTMSKEEKAKALEELQIINKEQLEEKIGK